MTAYSAVAPVFYNTVSGDLAWAQSLALQNSSLFKIRIARISFSLGGTSGDPYIRIHRYEVSSISGGTSTTPFPMRQGASPTGVTCRCRMLNYDSGTSTYSQGSAVTVTGTPKLITISPESPWEPPFELLISPGSALYLATGYANNSGTFRYCTKIEVYYEEVQEDWTT